MDSSHNVWNANNTETTANDNPVVKTIYDPSPAGYCVPPSNAFTGISCDGIAAYGFGKDINSPYNSGGEFAANFGWVFYCNKMVNEGKYDVVGGTIFYPAVGVRSAVSGYVSYMGLRGFYWSAGPASRENGREVYFHSEYVGALRDDARADGKPVRPVREQ